MQRVGIGAGIGDLDLHQKVGRACLGIVSLDHPIAVLVEHPRVQELVLRLRPTASAVLHSELLVGEGGLRIVVPPTVPCMAGDGIEVPPVFLRVLAVVGLGSVQAIEPLLQDRITPVPKGKAEAHPLLDVREASQAVLPPAVGTGSRVVVGKVVPGFAVGAVVLSNGGPLALAHIWPPPIPVARRPKAILQVAEAGNTVPFVTHRAATPLSNRSPLHPVGG